MPRLRTVANCRDVRFRHEWFFRRLEEVIAENSLANGSGGVTAGALEGQYGMDNRV